MSTHVVQKFAAIRETRATNFTGTTLFAMSNADMNANAFGTREEFAALLARDTFFSLRVGTGNQQR